VNLFELFRVAIGTMAAHKLRTFLTLLGVILGVMTVVSVVSVISGLNAYVRDTLAILTPELFIVTKFGVITSRDEFLEARRRKDLTMEDYEAIVRDCGECAMVGAQYDSGRTVMYMNRKLSDVRFSGATANINGLFKLDVEAGRWFTSTEYDHGAPVAIIGYDVKDELFPRLDPIGRTIKVEGRAYRVIGLMARRGSFFGESQDKEVNVPLTAYQEQFGSRRSVDIFVAAVSPQHVPLAQDEVRAILRARRHTPFKGKDPFGMVTGEAIMIIWRQITLGLFAAMVLISGISLVVGGIVIANIMLVSVTERTREIGVRMALGARKRYVALQFLIEAALMSLAGGAIGLALGAGIAAGVANATPLPTRVTPFLVLMSLSVATAVGIIAGFAPSIRAANLDPVEALRSE
jgi:putative ABC transport system permease protein